MIDIPSDWRQAYKTIQAANWRRVLVLGAVGAGKSTFCRYLARSWDAMLLDADVGQQDIGPPATIALQDQHSSETHIYFVGGTSPMGQFMALLAGTARLARRADGRRLVCNTSGLISGAGLALKTFKIDALQPDALVMLEFGTEMAGLKAAHRHMPILALRPSPLARRRSSAERRSARQAGFARYLKGACDWEYSEITLQRRPPASDAVEGLLCGLSDRSGNCLGIGLLRSLDPLRMFSSVPAETVRLVQFGELHLAPDGRELRRSRRKRETGAPQPAVRHD